jgi:hypothetical protein
LFAEGPLHPVYPGNNSCKVRKALILLVDEFPEIIGKDIHLYHILQMGIMEGGVQLNKVPVILPVLQD